MLLHTGRIVRLNHRYLKGRLRLHSLPAHCKDTATFLSSQKRQPSSRAGMWCQRVTS